MDVLGYGVCRLALVPVRLGPEEQAPQVTQLLFGDHYEMLKVDERRNRILIRVHMDATEGWIDASQHHGITHDYFEQINLANFKITTDLTCGILYKKSPLTILLGSIVPISNSELFKMEEQFAFNGESKSLGQKREFEFVKNIAQKYLNAPQVAGGKSPFGIDPSGFIQMVMKIAGYPISRLAQQQINEGNKLTLEERKPGDVAFFKTSNPELHTGIVLDDRKIIHADGRVRIDQLNDEGIINSDTKTCTHQLVGIRRYINANGNMAV